MLPTSVVVTPGFYTRPGQAALLRPGQYAYFLQNQGVVSGQNTIAFQLERTKSGFFYPVGFSVEIAFSANPGAFEVDIQTSDTDQDAFYVTNTKLTSGLNPSNVGRIEMVTYWALFTRLSFATITNPGIVVTAKITR